MTAYVLAVTVDAHDAPALAAFWRAALGRDAPFAWDDKEGAQYVELRGEPTLVFQPVPDDKHVKNRLHLDLAPADGTQDGEIDRLVGLGARVVDTADGFPWTVLTDPEGNEFCVLPPR
ncbi:VOC family protein [Pseudonocardia sulfidoxydans]|nr:VOC family protein [Pseudonocardia sulfidoxydans]